MNMGNAPTSATAASTTTTTTNVVPTTPASSSSASTTSSPNNNNHNDLNNTSTSSFTPSQYKSLVVSRGMMDQQFFVNEANRCARAHGIQENINFTFSYDREPGTMIKKVVNGQTIIPCDAKGNPLLHNDGRINKIKVLVYTNMNKNNQIRVGEAVFTNEPIVESIFIDQRTGKETNLSEIMESQRKDVNPIELRHVKEVQVTCYPTLHREVVQDKKLEILYTAIARCANYKKSLVVNIPETSNLANAFAKWNDPVFFFDAENKENGTGAYTVNPDKIRVSKKTLHETLRTLFLFKTDSRVAGHSIELFDTKCEDVPVRIRDLTNGGKRKNNLHILIGSSKLITGVSAIQVNSF